MARELDPLELDALIRISEAQEVFYQFPTKRHTKSHRTVLLVYSTGNSMAANSHLSHLNVSIVDALRLEGYLHLIDKNSDRYARIRLTDSGKAILQGVK